jgi:hypothetical protein
MSPADLGQESQPTSADMAADDGLKESMPRADRQQALMDKLLDSVRGLAAGGPAASEEERQQRQRAAAAALQEFISGLEDSDSSTAARSMDDGEEVANSNDAATRNRIRKDEKVRTGDDGEVRTMSGTNITRMDALATQRVVLGEASNAQLARARAEAAKLDLARATPRPPATDPGDALRASARRVKASVSEALAAMKGAS